MAAEAPSYTRQGRQPAPRMATALILGGVVCCMVGLAFGAVPLYQLFCQVTGFGGTTQVAEEAPAEIGERHRHRPLQRRHRARPAVALQAGTARDVGARRRDGVGLLQRREPVGPRARRHLDLQRHAGEGRRLLQQDRMLLLRGADARAGRARRVSRYPSSSIPTSSRIAGSTTSPPSPCPTRSSHAERA